MTFLNILLHFKHYFQTITFCTCINFSSLKCQVELFDKNFSPRCFIFNSCWPTVFCTPYRHFVSSSTGSNVCYVAHFIQ